MRREGGELFQEKGILLKLKLQKLQKKSVAIL